MANYLVNSEESLLRKIAEVRCAQQKFATFDQKLIDEIFLAAASAANRQRIPLAKLACEETGMGIVEDKVIKNHYASEYIYNAYKNVQTRGVIERDEAYGITRILEPVGVIAAIVPTTNPTATAIFKALISLKTANGIIFSPHPRARQSTIAAAKIVLDAAVQAGAPEGIIGWIDEPSVELSELLMKECDLTLATGGPGMVKAAYSSGKPAVGVGAGNTPAILDESCDLRTAVSSILHSKTFDNGMICASEQSVLVPESLYDAVKAEFTARGAHICSKKEADSLRKIILVKGSVNAKIVGQSAHTIAKMAGFEVPETTKVLIGETADVSPEEPFAHEKLSPVLAMYRCKDYGQALDMAERLLEDGGYGHTAAVYLDTARFPDRLELFYSRMKAGRLLVNTPAAQGGIGDLYNFALSPSLTLGCGSWGGNSVSENVGVKHLLNVKTVAERRENMLWLRTPEKVYFKKGCLGEALKELPTVLGKKRAFLVTDRFLLSNGYTAPVTEKLEQMGIPYAVFSDVEPDPTLACAQRGAQAMAQFKPDVILALGGGSAMDAGKIMWLLYEHPECDFRDMAMRFMDIRKRVYTFPKMGEKAAFIAIPTSAGTGSEVTPFAVITDGASGIKYPLADYELLPDMAIVDADLMMSMPKGLTAASGIDALTHALEAYASLMASDYTDGMALTAIKNIFRYLPEAYAGGAQCSTAREKMADASTLAGMAFANAFLGVCHSMAHKLGGFLHLPHGVANALLIEEVMRFNASETPVKMGTFPQYRYPHCLERYAEIASFLNIPGQDEREKFEGLLTRIAELKKEIGIPESIRAAGITEEQFLGILDEMTEQAFDDQCTGANPRYPLMKEIRQMYLNAFYGTHTEI